MNDTPTNVTLSLQYGDLDHVFGWCQENCAGEWDLVKIKETAGQSNGVYQFSFDDSSDVVVFSLRWL